MFLPKSKMRSSSERVQMHGVGVSAKELLDSVGDALHGYGNDDEPHDLDDHQDPRLTQSLVNPLGVLADDVADIATDDIREEDRGLLIPILGTTLENQYRGDGAGTGQQRNGQRYQGDLFALLRVLCR